jgi:PIN domain nuclease of toxin-antitoxin system
VILLDTHVWIWWVHGDERLTRAHRDAIAAHERIGIGVSAISCWEVAKLVQNKRLVLPRSTLEWLDVALGYPGVQIVELSPRIAAESTALPGDFHKDPADQIIVATARVLDCPLLTVDQLIVAYPHVHVL